MLHIILFYLFFKTMKTNQLILLTISGLFVLSDSVAAIPAVRPNVVVILADDMGVGDVSYLNSEGKIKTPGLDRMASSGIVFTDAHSSSSVCTPTRYSLLTGRYNWRSTLKQGVLNGFSPELITPGRATLASMLKKQGYDTACIGKWHLGWTWAREGGGKKGQVDYSREIQGGPIDVGFDYFFGISASLDMPPYVYVENRRVTSTDLVTIPESPLPAFWRGGKGARDFSHENVLPELTRRVEQYLDGRADNEKPFFLYFPLPAPHTPIVPTPEYQRKSGLSPYGDYVMEVDGVVASVQRCLEKNGLDRNTLVIFTADNGCSPAANTAELERKGHHASGIYRGYKADLYDGGHRIPLFASWPEKITPHKVNQTVCLTDFMATLAGLTGYEMEPGEGEDSFDLSPVLLAEEKGDPIREATVHHSINGSFSIRQGRWKLLLAPDSGGWSAPKPTGKSSVKPVGLDAVQLYDMEAEPGEEANVRDRHPDIVRNLVLLLKSYIERGRSTPGPRQENDGSSDWAQVRRLAPVFQWAMEGK